MKNDVFVRRLRTLLHCHPVTGKRTSMQMLGDVIGSSPAAVCLYAQGKQEPGAFKVLAIAKYFNVSTDYLLGNEESPQEDVVKQLLRILSDSEDILVEINCKNNRGVADEE